MRTSIESPADWKTDDDYLRELMRRQFRLSVACGVAFAIALVGLPLANYYFPALMAQRLAGFPLSWLILGVLFFPYVWLIAWVFIRLSLKYEKHEADLLRRRAQK